MSGVWSRSINDRGVGVESILRSSIKLPLWLLPPGSSTRGSLAGADNFTGDALRARSRVQHRHCARCNLHRCRYGYGRTSTFPLRPASSPADTMRRLRRCLSPDGNPLPGTSRAMNGDACRQCSRPGGGSTRPRPVQICFRYRRARPSVKREDSWCLSMRSARTATLQKAAGSTTARTAGSMMGPTAEPTMRIERVTVAAIEQPG
jgi:hypothetical protein